MSLVAVAVFIAVVNAGGAWSVVIDERIATRFLPQTDVRKADTWTPEASDIAHAELLLRPYGPARSGLDDSPGRVAPEDLVSRTWYGAVIDGQRLLMVDGYCSGGLPTRPLYPYRVDDGGPCYWSATIDAEAWEVFSYSENGKA